MRKRIFRRSEADIPELNTSSLPDLIFTVLFFFMLVTHMRQVDPKVSYEVPQGTEVRKLGHKSSVVHIYIGKSAGGDFAIQLNNRIATVDEIKAFIESERRMMSAEDQSLLTVSIKADREVPMGIISDVKHSLQQSMALRINYAAIESKE